MVIGGRVCYTHFAPAKAHLSPLQITGPEAVDAQLAALKAAAASGCTLFVGGHGAPATPAEVEFQIAYLEKLKSLVAEKRGYLPNPFETNVSASGSTVCQ